MQASVKTSAEGIFQLFDTAKRIDGNQIKAHFDVRADAKLIAIFQRGQTNPLLLRPTKP